MQLGCTGCTYCSKKVLDLMGNAVDYIKLHALQIECQIQIWVAAPVKPVVPQGTAGFYFFYHLKARVKRRNKKRNIGSETKTGQGFSCPAFLFYWPCALRASRTACPARRMLSSFAWAYMRRVTAVSLWPRRSLTETTSAPLVIARLAEVWRSLCGWKSSTPYRRPNFLK